MPKDHPCVCDVCYVARDAELARAREGIAQMLEAEAKGWLPSKGRATLVFAAAAIRRGRFLTEKERLENLRAAFDGKSYPHPAP